MFVDDARFTGIWKNKLDSSKPFFNYFSTTRGTSFMYYLVDLNHDMNETRMIFTFLEDKYMDSKRAYLVINLTRSNYTEDNSTFYI